MRSITLPAFFTIACAALLLCALPAQADEAFAQRLFKQLIDSNTAPSGGNDMSESIEIIQGHLRDAGFSDDDMQVVQPEGKAANLLVTLRSPAPTQKPVLLMAHLDVVEALREDWSFDPYNMIERDGYFYGRGTVDNKAGVAIIVANLIRMKREGFRPNRDLVAMLTGDEESTGDGALWLSTEGRHLIDAEFALNSDGGSVTLEDGEATVFGVQTSEKVYVSFRLQALDPGGHSSRPRRDNPVYALSRALADQQQHAFPLDLNDTTRRFFAFRASVAPDAERPLLEALADGELDDPVLDALPDHPYYNSLARTTCVVTQIEGGHAENALPQSAVGVINCRVVPQADVADVMQTLADIAAPHGVTVTQIAEARPSPPSPLMPAVLDPVSDIAEEMWPGIAIVPQMSTGATDGLFVRSAGIPVYGVSAIAADPAENRAHGQDERISVEAFNDALRYWYRLTRQLSGG